MRGDALERMRAASLAGASLRIARAVLADPDLALTDTVTSLGARSGASAPSVARFCRTLGYDGFAGFRVALASAIEKAKAGGAPPAAERATHEAVRAGEDTATWAPAILRAGAALLSAAAETVEPTGIERAVALLDRATRIFFFGQGGSGAVAADAQHKFVRLEASASAPGDSHLMTMAALGARPGDVVVAISNSGRTRAVIEAVGHARDAGASAIAIAPGGSPLAAAAEVALAVEPVEDVDLHVATSTRLAHLALIDVLATGVALRRGADYRERMAAIKRALAAEREGV